MRRFPRWRTVHQQSRCRFALIALFLAMSGCRSPTDSTEKFAGIYELDLVNGHPLPSPLESVSGCSRSVVSGQMSLGGPGVNFRLPLYAWSVSSNESCVGAIVQSVPQAFDGGVWSTDGRRIFFEHRWDRSYPITVSNYRGDGNTDGSPVSVELSFDGNTYRFKYVSLYPTP